MKRQLFKKIMSGLLSVTMLLTMVPDIWMPVHADAVRDEIIQDDENSNNIVSETNTKEYNGHIYRLIDDSMSWINAKSYCESIGGHLVTITDKDEQQFISNDLLSLGNKQTYWLGGFRNDGETKWQWTTEEIFEYSNWAYSEPNHEYENYIQMYKSSGEWNNISENYSGNTLYSVQNSGIICEWDSEDNSKDMHEKFLEYTVFSSNQTKDLTLSGWKSNFTGNIYTGKNFTYNGSEFYVNGRIDAVGSITTNGWKTEITERNEAAEALGMPDFSEAIIENAGECAYYEKSPSYIQDKNIVNGSIKVNGNVNISGTTFEGDCYIIAEGDITYNVQTFNSKGRVVLYSKTGNITINGSDIDINGILYAPKGNVSFNTYDTTLNGRIYADNISFNGSIFNISGSDADLELITVPSKGIVKTYTTDEDFSEGTLNEVSQTVSDQLILSEKANAQDTPVEKVFGNTETGNGIKVTYSADKSTVSAGKDNLNASYDLSGFGNADINENAVDLVIVVDESGSMGGSNRMTNAKAAAKEVVAQMKENDRCAVVGFTYSSSVKQNLTSDKKLLNNGIENLRASGGTYIYTGIQKAIDIFKEQSNDNRQKFIILLSDGEDGAEAQSLSASKNAGLQNIRIFSMMIGTGTLQMQNIAINSNGIYKNAPSSNDIGKIMSYFASEVFNTAGRNAVFRTTVKNASSINIPAITPAPSNITQNNDGSVTLEWTFDRISIDEAKSIKLPFNTDNLGNTGIIELTENTSCVYYDRNGKPYVIYPDNISIPATKYTSAGEWSAVYDSKEKDVNWSNINWNGKRFGDGKIEVTASVSDDGKTFGEAVPVNNYENISGLTGRYIKLDVKMTASSDGKTPELYDITVMSDKAEQPIYSNAAPQAKIVSSLSAKVNVPMNIRADISDDCLKNNLSIIWSSDNDMVKFADSTVLMTTCTSSVIGKYKITCTVNDGEKTVSDTSEITVGEADSYADIDPENGGVALAPEISVDLPETAEKNQVINAKIENLNNTEISWYSVIFNSNTPVIVADDGSFTLTMPNRDGSYKVVVRAFDWAGKSEVKEYTIKVDSTKPTVSVTTSQPKAEQNEAAYFIVQTTLPDKIKTTSYTLNGETVNIDENGNYKLDTSKTGTYTFTATAVTIKGGNNYGFCSN